MKKLLVRIGAIIAHALANIILITYLTNFDISGSWASMAGFILLIALLLMLLIRHILSFLYFLKTKAK